MDIVVQYAELMSGPGGQGVWKISADVIIDGETEHQATIMPADAIEWRVAQFNVDAATACEMVMLEPFITGVTHHDLELQPTRSAARQAKLDAMADALAGGAISWPSGPPQWTVGTGNEPTKILDSGEGSALETILAESPVDDEIVAVKREALDRGRERVRARVRAATSGPATPPPAAKKARLRRPTVDELRAQLQLGPTVEAESSGPADIRTSESHRRD